MSNFQNVSEIILRHAEQSEDWTVGTSNEPERIEVSRTSSFNDEIKLLVSLQLLDHDQARLSLTFEGLEDLANQLKGTPGISGSDKDSPEIHYLANKDGVKIYQDLDTPSRCESGDDFESLIESLEKRFPDFIKMVRKGLEAHGRGEEGSEGEQVTTSVSEISSVSEVIISCLSDAKYNFEHESHNKRFILGFKTINYRDTDEDCTVTIGIEYQYDDLVRIRTPMLYKFDLDKTSYSLIAQVIAWYQYRYKFLALSLDPTDGVCAISIDIPVRDAQIYESQVERIISFIFAFVEETSEGLFKSLLVSSKDAQKALDEEMAAVKDEYALDLWLRDSEKKMKSLAVGDRGKLSQMIDELSPEYELLPEKSEPKEGVE